MRARNLTRTGLHLDVLDQLVMPEAERIRATASAGIPSSHFRIYRIGGLAARPSSCCKVAALIQTPRSVAMTQHAVVIVGAGPTGLMLAGELALAGVDVAIVERRLTQDFADLRAGGLHSRTLEVLDQRGIVDRFLSEGQLAQVGGFAQIKLDLSDFPTRHPYVLGLWQSHFERILAGWV